MIKSIKTSKEIILKELSVRPDERGYEIDTCEYYNGVKIIFLVNNTELGVFHFDAESIYLSETKEKFLLANCTADIEAELDLKKMLNKKINISYKNIGEYTYIYIVVKFLTCF